MIFILSDQELRVEMNVQNIDTQSFEFTVALHTYFRTEISKTGISPLKGLEYIDKVKNGETSQQESDTLRFAEEIDRVYKNSPSQVTLETGSGSITVSKSENLKDFGKKKKKVK